jgi:hypothetical protein
MLKIQLRNYIEYMYCTGPVFMNLGGRIHESGYHELKSYTLGVEVLSMQFTKTLRLTEPTSKESEPLE